MGLTGIVAQTAPAIGPTLTGLLIDFFSWRMPFYIVAAIALIAFAIGFFFVENNGQTKETVLDKISVVYSTFGFGLILFAFSSKYIWNRIDPSHHYIYFRFNRDCNFTFRQLKSTIHY